MAFPPFNRSSLCFALPIVELNRVKRKETVKVSSFSIRLYIFLPLLVIRRNLFCISILPHRRIPIGRSRIDFRFEFSRKQKIKDERNAAPPVPLRARVSDDANSVSFGTNLKNRIQRKCRGMDSISSARRSPGVVRRWKWKPRNDARK